MAKVKLTDRLIASAKAGDYFDAGTRGLQIRVSESGIKSWFVVYTSPRDGKRARCQLGRYPSTSLATARGLAVEAWGLIEAGVDPRDQKPSRAGTVASLVESYLQRHAVHLRGRRHVELRFRKNVLPVIGDVRLSELHRRDVQRCIDIIMDRGSPASASRTFADVQTMMRWAVGRGDLEHDPIAHMRVGEGSKPRERVLSDDELRTIWTQGETVFPAPVGVVLKLCMVTGQRVEEVAGMDWGEVDREQALWIIPAARSKNKHAHAVPLSDLALELIARASPQGRLFPLPPGRVTKKVWAHRESLGLPQWGAHDLRRTFCTRLVEAGVSPLTVGAVVNHRGITKAGVTLGTYVHYSFDREKRAALDLWADRLRGIVAGGVADVVPIRA